jgi:hypothetical protein
MQREGGCAVVRQAHLIAVVGTFLMGCAVLLMVVGCSGVRSEASNEEQGHTEATKEQERSPEATVSEEARCEKTRTFHRKNYLGSYVTNDVPGCPKGGLLSGTDGPDILAGMDGDDKIRGLGDQDVIEGGPGNDEVIGDRGNDVLLGGPASDVLYGGPGADQLAGACQTGACHQGHNEDVLYGVLYGGDGNDQIDALDGQRDELYCGGGWDRYRADEKGDRYMNDAIDYVDSSCEKKGLPPVA